jgi:hypothetical protein
MHTLLQILLYPISQDAWCLELAAIVATLLGWDGRR